MKCTCNKQKNDSGDLYENSMKKIPLVKSNAYVA